MIRIALVGCGEHSEGSHAAPLARYASEHPGAISLAAACDLNVARAEEFCRRFGFARAYSDLDELLIRESVDACVAVMPVERIAEVGAMLLGRGVPCVIEKPLGASLDEVERLARVARETGTPHMVSVNRRFIPYLNRATQFVRENGGPRYVRATMARHARDESDFISTTAIHAVDALRHVAGEVADFKSEVLGDRRSSARWFVISLDFEGGVAGRVEILPTAGVVEETYEIFGEGSRAQVVCGSGSQRSLKCWRDGRLEIDETADDVPEDVRNGGYGEVVEFVRALSAGERPRPTIEDILPSSRICFSVAESA
ncbi:MAG TPA: Gfo/Idh/MocA family oxidoreductase [Pyrinomonadaceae bacterium]|jgi:predicted dehydrogenase|nr:Gfo/Idh/MocA family oxidoreductase [Pyrinomonadaceae bacterium]